MIGAFLFGLGFDIGLVIGIYCVITVLKAKKGKHEEEDDREL